MESSQRQSDSWDYRIPSEESYASSPATLEELLDGVDIRGDKYYWADTGEEFSAEAKAKLEYHLMKDAVTGEATREPHGISITVSLSHAEAQDALLNVLMSRRMQALQQQNLQFNALYNPALHAPQLPPTTETASPRENDLERNGSTPAQNQDSYALQYEDEYVTPTATYSEVKTGEHPLPSQTCDNSLIDSLPGRHSFAGARNKHQKHLRPLKKQQTKITAEHDGKGHPIVRAALGRTAMVFLAGTVVYAPLSYAPLIGNDEHFLPAAIWNGQVAEGWDKAKDIVASMPLVGSLVK